MQWCYEDSRCQTAALRVTEVIHTVSESRLNKLNSLNEALVSFIKHQLGVGPQDDEAESLRLELTRLRQKYDQLMEENTDLRSRLLRYEPAQDVATE